MKNNVAVLGIGRLGLCLALNLAQSGYNVTGYDIRKDHVDEIRRKIFKTIEPGVEELIRKELAIEATTDLYKTLGNNDILFVTVRTESLPDGRYDHSQVETLIKALIDSGEQKNLKTLIINCNVNPGYSDEIHQRLRKFNFKVSFNPEWVAQGRIIQDQIFPDLVVIGEADEGEGEKIISIYKRMCKSDPVIHRMDRLSAEITKVALNCFLTTKISFANMIGDIAIAAGADPDKILKAIGSDSRVGSKYFQYGFGYGGPCFPRDNKALTHYSRSLRLEPYLSLATHKANTAHLEFQVKNFIKKNPEKQRININSVSYKKGVDIILESQQLLFAVHLAKSGYSVKIRDITGVIDQVKKIYGDLFDYEQQ